MARVLNYLFLDSFELNLDFHSFHFYAAWHFFASEIDWRTSFFLNNIRPLCGTGLEFCTVVLYNNWRRKDWNILQDFSKMCQSFIHTIRNLWLKEVVNLSGVNHCTRRLYKILNQYRTADESCSRRMMFFNRFLTRKMPSCVEMKTVKVKVKFKRIQK